MTLQYSLAWNLCGLHKKGKTCLQCSAEHKSACSVNTRLLYSYEEAFSAAAEMGTFTCALWFSHTMHRCFSWLWLAGILNLIVQKAGLYLGWVPFTVSLCLETLAIHF